MAPLLLLLIGAGTIAAIALTGSSSGSGGPLKVRGTGDVQKGIDPWTGGGGTYMGHLVPPIAPGIAKYKKEIFATPEIEQAWRTIQYNLSIEGTGEGDTPPSWLARMSIPREVRDALSTGVLRFTCNWDSDNADKNAPSAAEVSAILGASFGSAATIVGVVGAAMAALGVAATTVTTVTTALSAALSSLGPAGAAAAVVVSVVVIVTMVCGEGCAAGPTCHPYFAKTRSNINEAQMAIARKFRDAGGRLSGTYPDNSTKKIGQWGYFNLSAQKKLEDWAANYLLKFEGVPSIQTHEEYVTGRTEPVFIGEGHEGDIVNAVIRDQVGLTGLEWISAPTPVKRLAFARFAGLGEQEAQWLAQKPGSRIGQRPILPKAKAIPLPAKT